uniref:Uncharacterized protein n=1 Tax=Leptobrachium leishanense TaxID=445787 RepID=A0A8C5MK86_9ANUR
VQSAFSEPSAGHLTCSICLNMYMDPVTLTCGHSFCRTCIGDVLDTQDGSGAYKCPECRAESQERPTLERNRKLRNIVETLNEASEKKKETLRNILQNLTSQREKAKEKVQNLEKLRRQVQGKAAGVTERVTLEIKKEELSRKMGDIEELCNMTDPLTVLQGRESAREASDMLLDVNTASNMLLDVNTASNYVSVSEDLKTVFWTGIKQSRPETPERFQYYRQVLSSSSFSSGRHYWEVEGSESGWWIVGMAYNSIERGGEQSLIGNNKKSWGLWRNANNQYYVRHDSNIIQLPQTSSCQRLGIFLDYEAGRLSFYELCDPIRHLHTFTAVFTEPLHAGLWISEKNTWLRIGGNLCQLK